MLDIDGVEAIRAGIAAFSLKPKFATRFTDKYVLQDSVNDMCQCLFPHPSVGEGSANGTLQCL